MLPKLSDLALPLNLARKFIPECKFPTHYIDFQRAARRLYLDDNFNRAIIACPIRMGKSFFWSGIYISWLLMIRPQSRVLLLSHSSDLATAFGANIKTFIKEWGYLNGIKVLPAEDRKDYFKLNYGGSLTLMGVHAGLSGRGFDVIVADDVMRTQEEAESPAQIDRLYQYWTSDVMTRLEPKGKVVVIMSRRSRNDLCGFLLNQNEDLPESKKWHLIRHMALSEDEKTSLFPERFPPEELIKLRNELILAGKSHIWECLYQNNPIGDTSLSEWNTYLYNLPELWYDHTPDNIRFKIICLDSAAGNKSKSGDFSALLYILFDNNGHTWIEDSLMLKEDIETVEDYVVKFYKKYKPDAIITESNGFQSLVGENIKRKSLNPNLPIYSKCNTENKNVRIRMMLTPELAGKRIHFKNTFHNKIIFNQMLDFPNGTHDDGPDALTTGLYLIKELINGV